jgi:hypothetical protein
MAKHKHVHQYQQTMLGKRAIFRCMMSNCPHYVMAELVLGRHSVCPRCQEEFIVDSTALANVFPHCSNCTKKNKEAEDRIEQIKKLLEANGIT